MTPPRHICMTKPRVLAIDVRKLARKNKDEFSIVEGLNLGESLVTMIPVRYMYKHS